MIQKILKLGFGLITTGRQEQGNGQRLDEGTATSGNQLTRSISDVFLLYQIVHQSLWANFLSFQVNSGWASRHRGRIISSFDFQFLYLLGPNKLNLSAACMSHHFEF